MLSCFSCVGLFATLWTTAHQVPISMKFSRQEYWSGLPCHLSGDLPAPWMELASHMSFALARGFLTTRATWEGEVGRSYIQLGTCSFEIPVLFKWQNLIGSWFCKFCISRKRFGMESEIWEIVHFFSLKHRDWLRSTGEGVQRVKNRGPRKEVLRVKI